MTITRLGAGSAQPASSLLLPGSEVQEGGKLSSFSCLPAKTTTSAATPSHGLGKRLSTSAEEIRNETRFSFFLQRPCEQPGYPFYFCRGWMSCLKSSTAADELLPVKFKAQARESGMNSLTIHAAYPHTWQSLHLS